jgi:hypothetical protein
VKGDRGLSLAPTQRAPGSVTQADVRDLLVYAGFDLGNEQVLLELPRSDRLRIDVEFGGAGERAPASRTVAPARGAATAGLGST